MTTIISIYIAFDRYGWFSRNGPDNLDWVAFISNNESTALCEMLEGGDCESYDAYEKIKKKPFGVGETKDEAVLNIKKNTG